MSSGETPITNAAFFGRPARLPSFLGEAGPRQGRQPRRGRPSRGARLPEARGRGLHTREGGPGGVLAPLTGCLPQVPWFWAGRLKRKGGG